MSIRWDDDTKRVEGVPRWLDLLLALLVGFALAYLMFGGG